MGCLHPVCGGSAQAKCGNATVWQVCAARKVDAGPLHNRYNQPRSTQNRRYVVSGGKEGKRGSGKPAAANACSGGVASGRGAAAQRTGAGGTW